MAFEYIYKYTDNLHDRILKLKTDLLNEHDADKRKRMSNHAYALFDALVLYYETVLSAGKFVDQRRHCRAIMEKLEPAYCQGYFTKKTKKKTL